VLVDVFTELFATAIHVVLVTAEYMVRLLATAPVGRDEVVYDMERVIGCSRNAPE
jgi:hypothetical protein